MTGLIISRRSMNVLAFDLKRATQSTRKVLINIGVTISFKKGDLVWINLRNERFPRGKYGKLHDRGGGLYKILKRAGQNAYVLELPNDIGVSPTLNFTNLQACNGESEAPDFDSRLSPFQPEESDARAS